jgi:hypothetical protein
MQKSVPFAAFIGLDWADKKHDVCLSVPGVDKRERSVIEHKPAALRAWAEKLRERFGGAPVAVCLELSQGPIVSALLSSEVRRCRARHGTQRQQVLDHWRKRSPWRP